jgi:hypothetical protein
MRTKILLLLFLLISGILNAQDTIRTLVISEVRLDDIREAYVEISNVGETTLNLSQFELGIIGAWTVPWDPGANYWFMLPNKELEPGKSFVAAAVFDWTPKQWLISPENYAPILNKKELWTLADIKLHFPESPTNDPTDSVTPYYHVLETWSGRDCIYLRQHISPTDSVVIDQVNGVFANADGTRAEPKLGIDVAGMTDATNEATLVRKFSVKQGNIDFESARGQDLEESEWMPIPLQLGHWEMDRKLFWTVGNHGDYNLDENTLVSSTIDINWTDSVLTVPWGVRKDDSIMVEFEKKPGLAWHYSYSHNYEDSAFVSARTGDVLTVYACGNDLDMINFKLQVAPPTTDANIVVPKNRPDNDGFFAGGSPLYIVTDGVPGMDTIDGYWGQLNGPYFRGIGFASRVDTLFKYLEKAPNATWEIVWVDGQVRTDLKNGDILKVTAENGSTKEYFIKMDRYRPSHNAFLSSITWPDIPDDYRGLFGWVGDTIPNFVPTKYDFKVQVPIVVSGVPALIGKNDDINATHKVDRAKNLFGAVTDRTVTFTSTAEDDTTIRIYRVMLEKEKDTANIQPWIAEPFISQLVWNEQWSNEFLEVCNPGNKVLDLSNYMLCFGYINSPSDAITAVSQPADWASRYRKYIPGYKWQDETNWQSQPSIAMQDLNVNPLVQPGDVFALGDLQSTGISGYPWWASQQCDIDFAHNPWNESISWGNALTQWTGANYYLFRIDNDSIKAGTKPANDPNDFTLIEVWGSGDGSTPVVGGLTMQQINGYVRKPNIYKGNTEFNGSFGTDAATSEWIMTDRPYYDALNTPWPDDILLVADGIGSHFMNDVTVFKSTVSSLAYKVSEGYSDKEKIRGVITDTTVNGFLANIIKADTGQTLTLKSAMTGAILALTDTLMNGDTLIVKSADKTNTSKYILEVTDQGLSSDAVLVSTKYTITVEGETGSVGGFDYGTNLRTIVDSVSVPAGASFNVIDAEGAYVPLKKLNFDTLYVDVKVSDKIFFEVVAENGINKIVYQLKPNVSESDAFVTSDVFLVDQEASLIDLVPDGTTASGFLANLVPATGATIKVVDKLGYERWYGNVVKDDKLVVTSADSTVTKTYYLQMLGEEANSLAYVVSDVYAVDQVMYVISGVPKVIQVEDFLAGLIPATGATMKLTDSQGTEHTGDLLEGDLVVVTAGNGVTTVTYSIGFVTSTGGMDKDRIAVYPNPTSDRFTVSGLENGYRIQVNNILGVRIFDKIAQQDKEVISLEGQHFGIYFITVSRSTEVVGRYKLILK